MHLQPLEEPDGGPLLRISNETKAVLGEEKLEQYLKGMLNLTPDQFRHNTILEGVNRRQKDLLLLAPTFCNVLGEPDLERDQRIMAELQAYARGVVRMYAFLDIVCSIMHPDDIDEMELTCAMNVVHISLNSVLRCMESMGFENARGYGMVKMLLRCSVKVRLYLGIN